MCERESEGERIAGGGRRDQHGECQRSPDTQERHIRSRALLRTDPNKDKPDL